MSSNCRLESLREIAIFKKSITKVAKKMRTTNANCLTLIIFFSGDRLLQKWN